MENQSQKPITERILTVQDVLADNGLTQEALDEMFKNVPPHFKDQHVAELLAKSLNEGWLPNWDNPKEYKYTPWFYMGGSSGFRFIGYDFWASGSSVGSRLCLRSAALAKHAGQKFTEVYKSFMTINQ